MKTKTKAMILAGVFVMTTTLPMTALARRGGAAGAKGIQGQTQSNEIRTRQQRLEDGSCVNPTGAESKGQNQTDQDRSGEQQRLRDESCVVPVE
ncbi:MAG: hypothetical protein LWW98_04705 [Deltaproteobacteria bacterium]|nr:hypothetical protein [Deltaproteobacteria bacterium]